MILTVDIGNTSCSCGLFEGESLLRHWYFATRTDADVEYWHHEIGAGLGDEYRLAQTVVGSVVPTATPLVIGALGKLGLFDQLIVTTSTPLPVKNGYAQPCKVGVDRLANVVAAQHLGGRPSIVVDVGTAITFDCLDENGLFVGGAILPGPLLQTKALHQYTAALPIASLSETARLPARSTEDAIRAGILLGIAGAVGRILLEITEVLGGNPSVIYTGGHAELITRYIGSEVRTEPLLTLIGLREILTFQKSL